MLQLYQMRFLRDYAYLYFDRWTNGIVSYRFYRHTVGWTQLRKLEHCRIGFDLGTHFCIRTLGLLMLARLKFMNYKDYKITKIFSIFCHKNLWTLLHWGVQSLLSLPRILLISCSLGPNNAGNCVKMVHNFIHLPSKYPE